VTSSVVAACMRTKEVITGNTDLSCKSFICLDEITSDSSLIQCGYAMSVQFINSVNSSHGHAYDNKSMNNEVIASIRVNHTSEQQISEL